MVDSSRRQVHIAMAASSGTGILFLVTAVSITALFLLPSITEAQQPLYNFCSSTDNYTTNSTYKANLDVLLGSLSSTINTTTTNGFSTNITGEVPDRIFGLALCRGDAKPADCGSCLQFAASDIPLICPFGKSGVVWYDNCFLRYSNRQFLSTVDYSQRVYLRNTANITRGASQFASSVWVALLSLSEYAARSDSAFAAGEMELGTNVQYPKLYWLVQCTRDISPDNCSSCLRKIIGELPSCCLGYIGGRVLATSCNFRFEVYSFFNWSAALTLPSFPTTPSFPPRQPSAPGSDNTTSTPPFPPPQPSTPAPGTNNTGSTTAAIGAGTRRKALVISLSVVFGTIIPLLGAFVTWRIVLCRRRKMRRSNNDSATLDTKYSGSREDSYFDVSKQADCTDLVSFDFEVILQATDHFSFKRKLGEGGFGSVHKGTLPGGQEVAVKRLSGTSRQGSNEFRNEVVLISKLQHRNLVQLLGCCTNGDEKLLIYEFMPNKSLNHFLFDASKEEFLDWPKRYHIVQGIAHGLLYLHRDSRLRIIHRDLKASNILLDSSMNPKISDFGIARIVGDQNLDRTNRVVGTFGYMSPEYAMQGEFSEKSDVFSFGVLLLEIISGKRIISFYDSEDGLNLLGYAWKLWNEDKTKELVEPLLLKSPLACLQTVKCVKVGLLCVQELAKDRPNMSNIVSMFIDDVSNLPIPKEPAFIGRRDNTIAEYLDDQHESTSTNEVTLTELSSR